MEHVGELHGVARVVLEADTASNGKARHVFGNVVELVGVYRALGLLNKALSNLT